MSNLDAVAEPVAESNVDLERFAIKERCERDHLYFTRYFFKQRNGIKFRVNWHHQLIADAIEDLIAGKTKILVINVPPGSSKTEIAVVSLMSRGLAINPYSKFLHLSYSDDLTSQNSQAARDIVTSDEYQSLWPLEIADDSKSKKRWNVMMNGKNAGGVYATSLLGQVTGFRAGRMDDGFQGCIIIDDPLKPEDGFSRPKVAHANRVLLSTVKSRKATPDTPILIIMQRIGEEDPSNFAISGNLGSGCKVLKIPALIDQATFKKLPEGNRARADRSDADPSGRFSYWPYKEKLADLLAMERGDGGDSSGAKISRYVFATQYQQEPVALGGNIIRGEYFRRHTILPKIVQRKIFADTAQKTKERNDFSVFACYGLGSDGILYLLDQIRGKWEAPELQKRAVAFWKKHSAQDTDKMGQLRKMKVEDKSSGTGLIQSIRLLNAIPVEAVERNKDKLTRVMDGLPYLEQQMVSIPEEAPFTNDFVLECEAFSADDSHKNDDQVDPLLDAIEDMLSTGNKLKIWERLAT